MNTSVQRDPSISAIRYGAFGAAIASLTLVGIAFVPLPAGLEYPGLPVLAGIRALSPEDLKTFLNGIRGLFALDGVFLLGWISAWTGLYELIRSSDPSRAYLVLLFGLAGALTDFGENGIILGALNSLVSGAAAPGYWIVLWKEVQHLSYWLPFAGAMLAAGPLWGYGLGGRIASLVGSILIPVAGAGLYFPALSLVSNLWFLIWFACLAGLLWFYSGKGLGSYARKG